MRAWDIHPEWGPAGGLHRSHSIQECRSDRRSSPEHTGHRFGSESPDREREQPRFRSGSPGAPGRRDVPGDRRGSVRRTVATSTWIDLVLASGAVAALTCRREIDFQPGNLRRFLGDRRRLASLSVDGSGSRRPVLVHHRDAPFGLGPRRRPRYSAVTPGRSKPIRIGFGRCDDPSRSRPGSWWT